MEYSFDYNIKLESNTAIKNMEQNYMQQYYILYVYSPDGQPVPVLVCPKQYIEFLITQT